MLLVKDGNCYHCMNKTSCYTSQLKNVFRLEENGSSVVGHNSLTPKGNNNINFGLAHDQVMLLKPWQISEPASVKQTISSQVFLVVLSWEVNKTRNDWSCRKQ